MKILFPFSGVACVSFPVGEPPLGTCEFATKQCLSECGALKNAKKSATSDEPGHIIGYQPKLRAFKFITERPLFLVCHKIYSEMKRMKTRILYWFASGDCIYDHRERILSIIKHLDMEGIIQCGFTRSEWLWEKLHKYDIRIALTVEDRHRATELSEEGLVAFPDFEKGRVDLYWRTGQCGSCGFSDYTDFDKLSYEANCQLCYNNRRGCFTHWDE